MNDHHRQDFDRVIRAMFLEEGRATCTQDHLDSYWGRLNEFNLHDVRMALKNFSADSFPKARKIAAEIRRLRVDSPDEFASNEARDYHYVRPGDVACRRCRLPVSEAKALEEAGAEARCPPEGRRLRVAAPPADRDAARQWYRDRANEVRPGSAWDEWTYPKPGASPNDVYEFEG